MDAMEFFASSAGQWRSQRSTHHLAFRQAEIGDSNIQVTALAADDERVAEICKLHSVDPSRAAGGALAVVDAQGRVEGVLHLHDLWGTEGG